jgi:rhodanese-related sulfurtransferase
VADGTATETDVTPQRASELVDSGAVVIDVRRDYEFDAGHIAGARHVEMNDLTANAESIPRDQAVVFYCRSGNRSGMAAAAFREAGFDAYHVEGGLQEWVDQGLGLEPPDGEVAEPRTGG